MWDKLSLYQFQQTDEINSRDLPEIDKLLFTVCVVFGMTEYQLDNTPKKKAEKLILKVSEIFSADFNPLPKIKIGKYQINYDPSTLTFGQYIEISYFLQGKPISMAHYTFASIVSSDAKTHRERAEHFLQQPITQIIGSLNLYIEKLKKFNGEYGALFGLDKEVTGDVQQDKFNKRYGWIYSASQVAEYERISLEQTFALPIRQALNDLVYLKAKDRYEYEQSKRN